MVVHAAAPPSISESSARSLLTGYFMPWRYLVSEFFEEQLGQIFFFSEYAPCTSPFTSAFLPPCLGEDPPADSAHDSAKAQMAQTPTHRSPLRQDAIPHSNHIAIT